MTDTDTLRDHLLIAIDAASGLDALEAVRVEALGKQGRVTQLLKTMGGLSPEERQMQGPAIHGLREAVTGAIAARKSVLERAALDAQLAGETLDMTLPAEASPAGTIHPVSQVMDELAEIFADLGFSVATGPEIETDWHNFSALNILETHPARAMHDTFYLQQGIDAKQDGTFDERTSFSLLRTHTSPVQIRTMLSQKPPIRIIAPGRTYRSDSDATHTPMFHQVEGLVIDKGITLGHLKWTLETFVKRLFRARRHRPAAAPELLSPSPSRRWRSMSATRWSRASAPSAAPSPDGWMEILGSGMVHPKVTAACGLDPRRMAGLRLRLRHRSAGDAEIRHGRSAPLLRRRSAVAAALRLRGARRADIERRSWRMSRIFCPTTSSRHPS